MGDPEGAAHRLAEVVSARICHDLGSPMSSLAALLPEAADPAAREVLREASDEMRARLELFGALFGLTDELGWTDIARLLGGSPTAHRVSFRLPGSVGAGEPFSAARARLFLVALLLAAEALPRGGVVEASRPAPGALALRLDGRQTEWSPTLLGLLAGRDIAHALDEGPRRVLAPWLMVLAAAEGVAVSLAMPAEEGGAPALLLSPAAESRPA